ncbi:MAG TPA: glycerophosphodiester phosphodiesterase [Solirubrobacteraceae bacterium]|jgi:glycerophosphoryl diester phosphodiesterase|nr:glycerophosphodiester phosphodiesterase [Solirubrobacteraceae bacterium]
MTTLPAIYAHRLGRDPGPDCSRAGLAATLSGPVDGLECDVCLTADGRLVLLHDPILETGTTAHGWAHTATWDSLRTARIRDRNGFPTGETPVLLEELLDATPTDLVVQIEVKAYGDPALARATTAAVARVLGRRADRDRVEVISFHVAACEEAARSRLAARLVTWSDYAPDALARWARRTGVGGVCVEHFLLHPELVNRLHSGGLSVTTGTINDAGLASRAAGLGVDAITTDRPAALRAELTVFRRAA